MNTMSQLAQAIFDWIFGCHHRSLSRVMTIDHQMCVVCLTCGTRFRYSWDTMSMGDKIPERNIAVALVGDTVHNRRPATGQLLPQ